MDCQLINGTYIGMCSEPPQMICNGFICYLTPILLTISVTVIVILLYQWGKE